MKNVINYRINEIKCSFEEYLVSLYLEELKDNGFIDEIIYQPEPFLLSGELSKIFFKEKVNKKGNIKKDYLQKKNLLNKHIYTPDFKILWNEKASILVEQDIDSKELNVNTPFISNSWEDINSYLEVKASFDQNNMSRMFVTHIQPKIYFEYREYVQLVKPFDLFKQTFIPNKAMEFMFYKVKTKKNQVGDKKYNWEYRTLNQYLDETNKNNK